MKNEKVKGSTQEAKEYNFTLPVKGKVLPLTEAGDEAFSSGALGKGVVISPKEGRVVAPFDAKVAALFPTNHAICLINDFGVELMVHIGIDTVNLKGKGFKSFVNQDDEVHAGDTLIEFDIDAIKSAGYSEKVMIIVTNTDDFSEIDVTDGIQTNGIENVIWVIK